MQNPVRMAMGDGGEKLEHECFDFGLQEGGRHEGQECFQVVFDKVHYDEHLGKRFTHDYFANANDVFVTASHEGVYFAEGGDGKPILLFIEF